MNWNEDDLHRIGYQWAGRAMTRFVANPQAWAEFLKFAEEKIHPQTTDSKVGRAMTEFADIHLKSTILGTVITAKEYVDDEIAINCTFLCDFGPWKKGEHVDCLSFCDGRLVEHTMDGDLRRSTSVRLEPVKPLPSADG